MKCIRLIDKILCLLLLTITSCHAEPPSGKTENGFIGTARNGSGYEMWVAIGPGNFKITPIVGNAKLLEKAVHLTEDARAKMVKSGEVGLFTPLEMRVNTNSMGKLELLDIVEPSFF